MEKTIKIVIVGELGENGRLNADVQRIIKLSVDPFQPQKRSFVLKEVLERFGWLAFVPSKNVHLTWTDEDGDSISILHEQDMDVCFEQGGLVPKIFINIINYGQAAAAPPAESAAATSSSGVSSATTEARPSTAGVLHPNVICDGCNAELRGCRYKCTQCHDFDLCQPCLDRNPHAEHIMLRMPQPNGTLAMLTERRLCRWLNKHIPVPQQTPRQQHCEAEAGASDGHGQRAGFGCPRRGQSFGGPGGRRHHQHGHAHPHAPADWQHPCGNRATAASSCSAPASHQDPRQAAAGGPHLSADHIGDAAALGFELLSQFSSILDPFGWNGQRCGEVAGEQARKAAEAAAKAAEAAKSAADAAKEAAGQVAEQPEGGQESAAAAAGASQPSAAVEADAAAKRPAAEADESAEREPLAEGGSKVPKLDGGRQKHPEID